MRKTIGIFGIIGMIIISLANVSAIGYGLYLWGGTGMALGLAVWTAFKFWIAGIVIGLVLFLTSAFSIIKN